MQQLALRTSTPAVKVAEPKPKAVHIKIEGEARKPKAKKGPAEAKWEATAEGQAHMSKPGPMTLWELLEERWPKGQQKPELHIASFERNTTL